jgi:hypothetical protein
MRYVLVILYLVAVGYILSPASIPDPVEEAAPVSPAPSLSVERPRMAEAPAPAPRATPVRAAPVRAISAPPALPTEAELTSVAPAGSRMTAVETASEQRTSTFAAPDTAERGESVARLVQSELSRLACLTSKPEKAGWGKKSRAALRRFEERARTGAADDPDAALLKLLRGYPQNYCKLCRPGRGACTIEATGTQQKRSEVTPPAGPPVEAAPSYLPPWMQGEKLAKAQEGPVQSDAPDAAVLPAPEVKKRPRRRASASRSTNSAPQQRRAWPALTGWPTGR